MWEFYETGGEPDARAHKKKTPGKPGIRVEQVAGRSARHVRGWKMRR